MKSETSGVVSIIWVKRLIKIIQIIRILAAVIKCAHRPAFIFLTLNASNYAESKAVEKVSIN